MRDIPNSASWEYGLLVGRIVLTIPSIRRTPETPMKLQTLRDLLIEQLQDLYDAEDRITKALPKMAKAAKSPELKAAFQKHLEETKGHVERLRQVFEHLGTKAKKKPCKAMQGLIEEGEETIKERADADVKDAALIAAAQRVEHYEMAAYGTVRAYAKMLKESAVVKLLAQTFAEEKATDGALTKLAESTINVEAA
jgi:ferritin-like metal-binding protein YciE